MGRGLAYSLKYFNTAWLAGRCWVRRRNRGQATALNLPQQLTQQQGITAVLSGVCVFVEYVCVCLLPCIPSLQVPVTVITITLSTLTIEFGKWTPVALAHVKKNPLWFLWFFCFSWRLTSHREFSRPPDHVATKLDFTGVIPNVIFLYVLDWQNVSFLDDTGTPLLGAALLYIWEGEAGQTSNFYPKQVINHLRSEIQNDWQ